MKTKNDEILNIDLEHIEIYGEIERLFYFLGVLSSFCPFCNGRHPTQRVFRAIVNDERETVEKPVFICKSCGQLETWESSPKKIPYLRMVECDESTGEE